MGIRQPGKEELGRLESKSLDAQFLRIVQGGLGCSAFEARAVLAAVQEVYFPMLQQESSRLPGSIMLVAVSADEPAGKSIADCTKQTISLWVHRGIEDDRLLQSTGPAGFRQARIPDLCQEALSQGALLTREDLAYRIFFVSPRTISRDLAELRRNRMTVLPLRSNIHDIGPVLTHRVQIVRLALAGKTMTEIAREMRHSPMAISNYLSTFTRCAHLAEQNFHAGQIAFLLRRSPSLIAQYLSLFEECKADPNFAYHLSELLQLSRCAEKKQTIGRSS